MQQDQRLRPRRIEHLHRAGHAQISRMHVSDSASDELTEVDRLYGRWLGEGKG